MKRIRELITDRRAYLQEMQDKRIKLISEGDDVIRRMDNQVRDFQINTYTKFAEFFKRESD